MSPPFCVYKLEHAMASTSTDGTSFRTLSTISGAKGNEKRRYDDKLKLINYDADLYCQMQSPGVLQVCQFSGMNGQI